MPRATKCIVGERIVEIDDAILERDAARAAGESDPAWMCIECNKPVHPHRPGGAAAGHFEHRERNPNCSLSDPKR